MASDVARKTAASATVKARMDADRLFAALERINERPEPYSRSTIEALWASPDISEMLLRFHLDGEVDVASRRTDFMDASAAWITDTFKLGSGARVIDLGCGPGLYTGRLAATGADVTGIDLSPRSIEYARAAATREGHAVDYVLGDYLTYAPDEPFDLAMMIMCDYCALAPTQREQLLARVREIVRPGGAFLFDVYSWALFETWDEQVSYGADLMDGFWSAQPYYGFLNTFRYDAENVMLEKYTIVQSSEVREYLNWFRHFDPASLRTEVEASGLRVETVLGDVAGAVYDDSEPEFAIVVRV
jgi:SAM-dependent methyltransferase